MTLCRHDSGIHGALPCPREAGHRGEHFWVIAWEHGGPSGWGIPTDWRVVVFSGSVDDRRRRCRGRFTSRPALEDVNLLLVTLIRAHERQQRLRARALEELMGLILPPVPAPPPRRKAKPAGPVVPAESAATRAARAATRSVAHG